MLTFRIDNTNERSLVILTGDLDIDATEIIEMELIPELLQSKKCEIDFSNVPFVDSSGIGLLIKLIDEIKENGVKVEVINLNPDVKLVFEMLQLPEILGLEVLADFHNLR
jgi:anti-anti-sigma factor